MLYSLYAGPAFFEGFIVLVGLINSLWIVSLGRRFLSNILSRTAKEGLLIIFSSLSDLGPMLYSLYFGNIPPAETFETLPIF